ncbi:hypothetical protein CIPAW_09G067400 [Carya illinoinensis]|uniref:Uncharacterized protein n=1 Tax=Carya illinoinensis TaxID=32201 RepID=A0A8T1PJV9_CARIL|nr:hypothetical protein CIPAW_09G067400 [Carya illinoinensis]
MLSLGGVISALVNGRITDTFGRRVHQLNNLPLQLKQLRMRQR